MSLRLATPACHACLFLCGASAGGPLQTCGRFSWNPYLLQTGLCRIASPATCQLIPFSIPATFYSTACAFLRCRRRHAWRTTPGSYQRKTRAHFKLPPTHLHLRNGVKNISVTITYGISYRTNAAYGPPSRYFPSFFPFAADKHGLTPSRNTIPVGAGLPWTSWRITYRRRTIDWRGLFDIAFSLFLPAAVPPALPRSGLLWTELSPVEPAIWHSILLHHRQKIFGFFGLAVIHKAKNITLLSRRDHALAGVTPYGRHHIRLRRLTAFGRMLAGVALHGGGAIQLCGRTSRRATGGATARLWTGYRHDLTTTW